MYIDFLTFLLVNQAVGLTLLACYVYWDVDRSEQRRWAPGFALSGLAAAVLGLRLVFAWPLPGSFNLLYGEPSLFFGILMLMMAAVAWLELDLLPVAVYGTFAGFVSFLLGIQVLNLGLTKSPFLSGVSFLWTGLVGVFAIPMLRYRRFHAFRVFGAGGLGAAALLWAVLGFNAYWAHVEPFMGWRPLTQQYQQEMQKPALPVQPQPAVPPQAK
jgi:putative membrane protein